MSASRRPRRCTATPQIQRAFNLDTLERTDEAKALLEKLIAEQRRKIATPSWRSATSSARASNSPNARTSTARRSTPSTGPRSPNWVVYYFRGICYERSKQWPKAEVDLKKALELFPDQPLVLNYLGYSWVDQGVNLDEGMRMIKRAVEQRPDDGYIVDSLGWAYYRLGNFEEAVKHLEHAVELKPEDPTINDHLGDAYWRVGRQLEAHFQWAHARDLKPEPDELEKIEEKLKTGWLDDTAAHHVRRQRQQAGRRLTDVPRCASPSGRPPRST